MTTESLITVFHNILNSIYIDLSQDRPHDAYMRIGAAMTNLEILLRQPEISTDNKKLVSKLNIQSFISEEEEKEDE